MNDDVYHTFSHAFVFSRSGLCLSPLDLAIRDLCVHVGPVLRLRHRPPGPGMDRIRNVIMAGVHSIEGLPVGPMSKTRGTSTVLVCYTYAFNERARR